MNSPINAIERDNLRHQDHTALTDKAIFSADTWKKAPAIPRSSDESRLRNITIDSVENRQLRRRTMERIVAVQDQIRRVDPDLHTALLVSVVGGIKCAAACNPHDMEAVVEVLEIIMGDFKKQD